MTEPVDREITLIASDQKVKGKVRLPGADQGLPPAASDPFLEIHDATLFEHGGKQVLLRQVRVRRNSILLYYFEDDVQARR